MRQKITANLGWFYAGFGAVTDDAEGEYIPGKSLSLTFTSAGKKYSVILNANPTGKLAGTFQTGTTSGPAAATPYRADDGSLAFIGEWREDGYDLTWLIHDVAIDE